MSPRSEHDNFVSTLAAAELTGLPEWWLTVLVKRGDIPFRIIEDRRFVCLKAVERVAEEEFHDEIVRANPAIGSKTAPAEGVD